MNKENPLEMYYVKIKNNFSFILKHFVFQLDYFTKKKKK